MYISLTKERETKAERLRAVAIFDWFPYVSVTPVTVRAACSMILHLLVTLYTFANLGVGMVLIMF